MAEITYSYMRVPTVRDFALSNARFRGLMGPFGSGKSSGCLWELIRRSLAQKPNKDGIRKTRWAIVRNTYPQLRDTTIKTVLDWLPERNFGQYKVATHDYIITGFEGCHIEFMFRALDNPEHVKNLLSLELTGAWLNEAREIPIEIVDAIDGRINRYPSPRDGGCTWTGVIMDTNPPDDESWWYDRFETIQPEGWELFKQPSGLSDEAENILTWDEWDEIQQYHDKYAGVENPPPLEITAGLHPGYYVDLASGKTKDFVDVYVHGKYGFLKEGKPVYETSYNDNLHIANGDIRPIMGGELVIGMDFGLTPCAIITQLTPRGRFIVLDELLSEGMGIEQFVRNMLKPFLKQRYPNYKVVISGDPAGIQKSQSDEKTCYDVLRAEGFRAIPSTSNSLVHRIGSVEHFLTKLVDAEPAFKLSPRCKTLRKGFVSGYHYRKMKVQGEVFSNEPSKNQYSHPHDALQYAAQYFTEGLKKSKRKLPKKQKYRAATLAGY